MSASCSRLSLSALLVTLLALLVTSAHAQEDVSAQVLRRINRARQEAGVPPLERHAQLDTAAQGHANDLLQNGAQLGHRGSDGSNIRQRIARAGYPGNVVGENWAGYRSLDKIFEFWLSDPPHYKNIVNPKYIQVGIGIAQRPNGGLIIVTDFGAPMLQREAAPAPPTAAPKKARATLVPTPVPPTAVPPTRRPTRQPTLAPTAIPPAPPPTQIALAQLPAKKSIAPLRARGKMARIPLRGVSEAFLGTQETRMDMPRVVFGGALSFGGALLLALSVIGHFRYTRRW